MYHILTDTVFEPTAVPDEESTDFFYYNGTYYLLQKNLLIRMSCEGAACACIGAVNELTPNTYRFA